MTRLRLWSWTIIAVFAVSSLATPVEFVGDIVRRNEDTPQQSPWSVQDSPTCNNEEDFKGHADIHEWDQMRGAMIACSRAPDDMGEASAGKGPTEYRYKSSYDVNYDYSIGWEPGCRTERSTQNVEKPLTDDGPTCTELLSRAYRQCRLLTANLAPPFDYGH